MWKTFASWRSKWRFRSVTTWSWCVGPNHWSVIASKPRNWLVNGNALANSTIGWSKGWGRTWEPETICSRSCNPSSCALASSRQNVPSWLPRMWSWSGFAFIWINSGKLFGSNCPQKWRAFRYHIGQERPSPSISSSLCLLFLIILSCRIQLCSSSILLFGFLGWPKIGLPWFIFGKNV